MPFKMLSDNRSEAPYLILQDKETLDAGVTRLGAIWDVTKENAVQADRLIYRKGEEKPSVPGANESKLSAAAEIKKENEEIEKKKAAAKGQQPPSQPPKPAEETQRRVPA